MKMVFLFDREIRRQFNLEQVVPDTALPKFEAYHYGPFSAEVYADIEFLVDLGFLAYEDVGDLDDTPAEEEGEYDHWQSGASYDGDDEPVVQQKFSLTPVGRQFVEDGEAGELTKDQWEVLDKFKARCVTSSLKSLLRYVYTKYPEMTTKSKIRDSVLK